jgi:Family of unknown function (DUF5999)
MSVLQFPARRPASTSHRPECQHQTQCPSADAPDHAAARAIVSYPEQGWSLLCNGVILFDDLGELLPDGRMVLPQRPTAHLPMAA